MFVGVLFPGIQGLQDVVLVLAVSVVQVSLEDVSVPVSSLLRGASRVAQLCCVHCRVVPHLCVPIGAAAV